MTKFIHTGPREDTAGMSRRSVLLSAAMLGAAGTLALRPRIVLAADKPTLVTSIRSLSNPYHATWNKGALAFAKSVGCEHVTLVTEGNSEKGIADIRAMLAKTGGKMVLNVDPNDAPDARPIVEASVKAGAYVVTQWNKPADLHPWDFNPNYVAHIAFDGTVNGELMANELFKVMGGKGGIVAIGGIISNTTSLERKAGLDNALAKHPGIKLLDYQVADWQSAKAYDLVSSWLTRFGDQIKGIWAANDDMAVGALEALRGEHLAGKVPVSGTDGIKTMIEAVRAGEGAATVSSDPFWQGSMGLSIGYGAFTGVFDPAKQPKDHREFYGTGIVVTHANADAFYKSNIEAEPKIDFNDYWGRVTGQIRPG